MSENVTAAPALTAKDFATDQEVRWCPGCGDYSILAQVQKVMPTLGIPKENIQVTYEDGVLTISGQQQIDTVDEDKKGKLIRSERSSTSLRRQYLLENVKEDEIKASYSDGILKVTLPKDSNKEIKKSIPIE